FTGFLQGEGTLEVSASGPAAIEHGTPYEVSFAWDAPMEYRELAYALVSVGDDGSRIGNIGNVPVRMERLRDDVRLVAAQDVVTFGEPVTYTVRIESNLR